MYSSIRVRPGVVSRLIKSLGVLALLLLPTIALAQDAVVVEEAPALLTQFHGDLLWTLIAACLVMFMQPGFACVECGFTRAKSAGNIIMKNFLDFAAGQPIFFLLGFGLMFGVGSGFIGHSHFGLFDLAGEDMAWGLTFWFFQSVFAATAATIVSGGIAERTKFGSYIIVSIIVSGIIYPISGHWAWGSLFGDAGWLETTFSVAFCDFAGSSVVHSVGGWVALAGAIVVGPRIGKYTADGKARAIPGHNIPLAALGVFILWFGWFGFNPGSTTAVVDDIGLIAVNTSLAACTGTLAAMCLSWIKYGKPDMSMTMNGCLAGLVAITAPCATVVPVSAMIIGVIAGILVVLAIEFIDKVLKVDDPVGAVSVHGVNGLWGTLACGLFNADGGLFFGGGMTQLTVQAVGAASFFVWAFGMGLITFSVVKLIFGVRVSREEELRGLDICEHGSEAYSGFQIFTVE